MSVFVVWCYRFTRLLGNWDKQRFPRENTNELYSIKIILVDIIDTTKNFAQ